MTSATTIASPLRGDSPGVRTVLLWTVSWAIAGLLIATAIAFVGQNVDLRPLYIQSLIFAEVVGLSVLLSTRGVFRFFGHLAYVVRLALQTVTLASATLLGSLFVIFIQPLYFIANPRLMGMLVLVNALVAVLVGTTLHAYESMRRQLEQSFALLAEKEKLERELSIARDVQQELLPREKPQIEGLELMGICRAAIGVGGDLYDWFRIDKRSLGLAIFDVSGKGISAALLVASLQSALRGASDDTFSPAEAAHRLNRWLCRSSISSRYATMFLAKLDFDAGLLHYCCAGHPAGVLVRDGQIQSLCERDRPIGLFEESTFGDGSVPIVSGDLLALCTDGVTEAPAANGEEYGSSRFAELLRQHAEAPLPEIQQRVLAALDDWAGENISHDDVTLVLVRVP